MKRLASGRASLVAGLGLVLILPSASQPWAEAPAEISRGRLGIGLSYPGIGLRYFILDRYSLEARAQYESDVFVGGLRLHRVFNPITRIFPYLGVETDYLYYKGEVARSSGVATELLAGGEYYIWRKLSVQLDFGPAYIFLKDRSYDVTAGGVEYVVNFGLNYYFGSGRDSAVPSGAIGEHGPDVATDPANPPLSPNSETELGEARGLYAARNFQAAESKLQTIVKTHPNEWRAWGLLGNCLNEMGKRTEALAAYDQSLALHPENPQLREWVKKLRSAP